jgi:hypothetical protein
LAEDDKAAETSVPVATTSGLILPSIAGPRLELGLIPAMSSGHLPSFTPGLYVREFPTMIGFLASCGGVRVLDQSASSPRFPAENTIQKGC